MRRSSESLLVQVLTWGLTGVKSMHGPTFAYLHTNEEQRGDYDIFLIQGTVL